MGATFVVGQGEGAHSCGGAARLGEGRCLTRSFLLGENRVDDGDGVTDSRNAEAKNVRPTVILRRERDIFTELLDFNYIIQVRKWFFTRQVPIKDDEEKLI